MNPDGDIGKYNRGNRSLHHFLESSLTVVVSLPVLFDIYPLPTFVLLVFFCIGRVMHQMGYATGGYGFHMPGVSIAIICLYTFLGLLIVSVVRLFMM